MILTSPADACANPMHGNIARGCPRRPARTLTSPSYAIRHGTVHLLYVRLGNALRSITVRTKTPDTHILRR
jgi:hypothetical protein